MSTNKKIILLLLTVSLLATIVGAIKVTNGEFNQISLPFLPLIIFVWGDALIFGPFFIVASIWLWRKDNHIWTGMFLSSYYIIRLFIEALYNLNAQFSQTIRPWESAWHELSIVQNIGVIQIHMLAQIFFTVGAMIALLFFVYFLKQYLGSKN